MNSLPVNSTPESTMSKGHTVADWRRRAPEGHAAGPCTQTCSVRAQKKEHSVAAARNLRRPPCTLGAQERALETAGQVPGGVDYTTVPGDESLTGSSMERTVQGAANDTAKGGQSPSCCSSKMRSRAGFAC
jgi:hypothetical protein